MIRDITLMADGRALGVEGTPSFFVNQTAIKDLSVEALKTAIDQSLQPAVLD